MPPKKAPEPPPEPPHEPAGASTPFGNITISPERLRMIGGVELDPAAQRTRERSSRLWEDPKMQDLQSSLRSGVGKPLFADTRSEGIDLQDRMSRRLATQATLGGTSTLQSPLGATGALATSQRLAASPTLAGTATLRSLNDGMATYDSPGIRAAGREALECARPFEPSRVKSELHEGMLRRTKRLMRELEFAQDASLGERSHHLRCAQLDKMHTWFREHGVNRKAQDHHSPHYLTYTKDDRVMVGSLRVEPNEKLYSAGARQKPAWMTGSSSTPVL